VFGRSVFGEQGGESSFCIREYSHSSLASMDDSSGMVEIGEDGLLATGLLFGDSKISVGCSGSYSSRRRGRLGEEPQSLKSGSNGDEGMTRDSSIRF
jgi:hypothetical protein